MAASQTGGGDTGGFYAEFYFDYCGEFWGMFSCSRGEDELGLACYNEMVRLLEEYGTQTTETYRELDNPINYGFEVYVEGSIVTELILDFGNYFLRTNGEYGFTLITASGGLSCEYEY